LFQVFKYLFCRLLLTKDEGSSDEVKNDFADKQLNTCTRIWLAW